MDEASRWRNWKSYVLVSNWSLPWDLVATGIFAVAVALGLAMPRFESSLVAPVLGIPLLVFCPGYVVVAALFPRRKIAENEGADLPSGIDLFERAALSFGVSLVVLPPLALVWWAVGPGLRYVPVALATFVCLGAVVALVRRRRVAPGARFRLPVHRWGADLRSAVTDGSWVARSVNIILLLSILLAVASIGFALAVPNDGEAYTGFYLATQNESGEPVASGFPTEFERNESRPLIVGVQNHEGTRTKYVVIVELQRVEGDGADLSVRESTELDRFQVTLGANEKREARRSITPRMVGRDLRVQYYLYRGTPPDDPSVRSAYRTAHLWINVTTTDR